MPIYDPYVAPPTLDPIETHSIGKAANPHHPHLDLPSSPRPTGKDTCHRHLDVDPAEWSDASASWHNRGWLDGDFTSSTAARPATSLPPVNKSTDPKCGQCGHAVEMVSSKPWLSDEYDDVFTASTEPEPAAEEGADRVVERDFAERTCGRAGVMMGPCTCTDGSLHMQANVAEGGEGARKETFCEDLRRETNLENARRELLFGDKKVDPAVAAAAIERLRDGDERVLTHENSEKGRQHHMTKVFQLGGEEEPVEQAEAKRVLKDEEGERRRTRKGKGEGSKIKVFELGGVEVEEASEDEEWSRKDEEAIESGDDVEHLDWTGEDEYEDEWDEEIAKGMEVLARLRCEGYTWE